jgi:hypothetical protein
MGKAMVPSAGHRIQSVGSPSVALNKVKVVPLQAALEGRQVVKSFPHCPATGVVVQRFSPIKNIKRFCTLLRRKRVGGLSWLHSIVSNHFWVTKYSFNNGLKYNMGVWFGQKLNYFLFNSLINNDLNKMNI